MKKIILSIMVVAVIAASVLGCVACSNKSNEEVLQVYTNAGFAPYEYVNTNGKVAGVDIDIMNYIGNALGYKVVINDVEFNTIPNYVTENKLAVGAAGMTKTDERDAIMTASISYATSVQYVILPKDTTIAPVDGKVSVDQLAGMKVGVQEGTTGDYLVEDSEVEGLADKHVEYKNAIIASQDIGKSIGAVIIDKLPAQSITSANSDLICYELSEEPESYVLYFNKEATELVAKVNEVLAKMIAEGIIDQYTISHS